MHLVSGNNWPIVGMTAIEDLLTISILIGSAPIQPKFYTIDSIPIHPPKM